MTASKPRPERLSATDTSAVDSQSNLKKIRYDELDAEFLQESRKLQQMVMRLKKRVFDSKK